MIASKIYKKLREQNGDTAQLVVAIEELSELTKEITKCLRNKGNFNIPDLRDRYIIGANTNALGTQIAEQLPNIDHLAEEVADVEIVVDQGKADLQRSKEG